MAPKTPKPQAAEEPAAKKAKAEEPKKEEPKKEEEPKFQEPDAAKDTRPAMTGKVGFATADTTMNVVPTVGGQLLTCLTDCGMAYLLAGARANVGQKAGRYMFEAKIVQAMGKSGFRIGFSTAESGLVATGDVGSVYFDSEGTFRADKKTVNIKGKATFGKDHVVAVVLNLDSTSPNANTIALYRDGVAMGEVQKLPESLQGKTLFPHLTYRNASLRVNFGPNALKELPFKCRTLQSAAAADVTVCASKEPKDGKYEVCMPVAFPDEGTFDWLDGFLEKHPHYVELSDRMIMKWAKDSGHWSKEDTWAKTKGSNDKPQLNTGIQELDNMNVRTVINAVASIVPRNYLVMEVKSNLVAAERQHTLKKFSYPCYKKVARVVMGEPTKDFKALVQAKLLKDKQSRSDNQWRAKKAENVRKKAAAKKALDIKKARKAAEKKSREVKAAAEEKKKKAAEEEAAKKKEEEKKDDDTKEEVKEEVKKEEEKKVEEKAESEDEKEVPEEPEETEAPTVELTDEEKKQHFLTKKTTDLTAQVMSNSFGKFTCPEKEEGFDDIVYEWQKGDTAKDYLKKWVLNKKLTTRIEDIRPGKAFKEKQAEFDKLSKVWKDKLAAYKAGGVKKAAKKEGDEEAEDIDIFSVSDICDAGEGVPLFDSFTWEDWELMKLRAHFCLLAVSFKVDCNDEDRGGIPLDHVGFYYQKYFGRSFSPKQYGVADVKEVVALIKDTATLKDGLLVTPLGDNLDSLDTFLKLTEEQRRERQRRIDAGDETARLHFVQQAEPKPAAPKAEKAATDGDKGAGKSWGKAEKGKGWGKDVKGKGKW